MIKHLKNWYIKNAFTRCLSALAQLQQVYFSCYLKCDYLVRQSDYEKLIYQKRSVWLRQMEHVRYLLKKNEKNITKWADIFPRIENISEIIFSLSQLRFRVKEDAIFEICNTEMQVLAKALNAALKNGFLNNPSILAALLEAIQRFENISQRTLQVASSEPIIFFLFIQDLYSLYSEIKIR